MTDNEIIEKARRLVEAVEANHAVASLTAAVSGVTPETFAYARLLVRLAEQTQWREIGTAPKDGTWILATCKGEYLPGCPYIPSTTRWGKCPQADKFGWLEDSDEAGCAIITLRQPFTHWMHIPKGPEE